LAAWQGSKKPGFFKKAQPSGFWGVLFGFGVLLGFIGFFGQAKTQELKALKALKQ